MRNLRNDFFKNGNKIAVKDILYFLAGGFWEMYKISAETHTKSQMGHDMTDGQINHSHSYFLKFWAMNEI